MTRTPPLCPPLCLAVLTAVSLAAGCAPKTEEGPEPPAAVRAQMDRVRNDASLTPEQKSQKIEEIQNQSAPSLPSMGSYPTGGTATGPNGGTTPK